MKYYPICLATSWVDVPASQFYSPGCTCGFHQGVRDLRRTWCSTDVCSRMPACVDRRTTVAEGHRPSRSHSHRHSSSPSPRQIPADPAGSWSNLSESWFPWDPPKYISMEVDKWMGQVCKYVSM